MKKKERAVVLSQECIATDIYSMWIETPDIAAEAIPGQFITLYTKDADKLLPRPISLCEIDKENGRLRIVYRIAGAGTKEFSTYKAGDAVDIMGPLGNGFSETGKKPMVIGGGIGIPPMLGLAKSLKESGSDVTAVLGYRSELFLQDEFASSSSVYNATEDGNSGTKGTVIDAIKENNLDADIIFACRAVSMNMTAEKNAPAFDTSVTIAGVTLKNPVMTASGTFGSGAEYSEFVDLNKLGAVVTKGVANVPWPGNPTPRIAETHSGMLNAIGLQNPGIDLFCKRDIPYLKQFDTKIIVNVCGRSTEDYLEVVERLGNEPVDMLEINISCPNVKEGGIAFGQDPKAVEAITKAVKAKAKQPVIMKLSPNVTDITVMAKAAEAGGADAISLINTLTGMKIDINRQCFALANKTGGLSGPAIKPIAVRMVYQAASAVSIPVIGMGGIACAEDALEFILAGASAVSIGTANFFNPYAAEETVQGIEAYMREKKVDRLTDLIGIVK